MLPQCERAAEKHAVTAVTVVSAVTAVTAEQCCHRCERAAEKHTEKARTLATEALQHRRAAEATFEEITRRLSGAAYHMHRSTAPFVVVDQQQALALKSWQRLGRSWVEVRLSLRDGFLTVFPAQRRWFSWGRLQRSLPLRAISAVRAHGGVVARDGFCSTFTRYAGVTVVATVTIATFATTVTTVTTVTTA